MSLRDRAGSAVSVAVPLAVLLGVFLLTLGLLVLSGRNTGDRFDLLHWQRTTMANKWVFMLGRPLRNDVPADEAIERYFALRNRNSLEARRLENVVEAAIEGRINTVLRELGVFGRLSLPATVFPPVDIELTESPRVLVTSPRAIISRDHTELLRPGLLTREAVTIEQRIEAQDPRRSALVVPSGGVAAYPAIVSNGRTYRATLATAAHEWVHHYLVFYPLGYRYFTSADLATINETVADLVGEEIAQAVVARWGLPDEPPDPPAAERQPLPVQPAADPPIDQSLVLRNLRLEVEELLAAGDVEAAERRMEEVRAELERAGYVLRRINQAYFAWYGTYAARPDSVDPLGNQLRAIRERAGSLPRFLELVRGIESRADVLRLLEDLTRDDAPVGAGGG